jgi:hypothetical protein
VQEKCRLNLKSQLLSLSREARDYCCRKCTESGRINTLRVVGGRAQEACAKVSEGVRVDKLRRDSSFVILWEQTQERLRAGRSFGAEEILKEENQRPGFAGRIAKSR